MPVPVQTPTATATANGVTVVFPYAFTVLDQDDLKVTGNLGGVITTYVLGVDYTVSGVGTDAGAATFGTPPASGTFITTYRDSALERVRDYQTGGDLTADTLDRDFDDIWLVLQEQARALTLPPSAGGVDVQLPDPESLNLIGWNEAADALRNFDLSDIVTSVTYGTALAETFLGTGANTVFVLSQSPGVIANMDVSIGGLSQVPSVDYTFDGDKTITLAAGLPAGIVLLVRYARALALGTLDANSLTYKASGAGAVIRSGQSKFGDFVNAADYGAIADGDLSRVAANSAAITLAIASLPTTGGKVYINTGTPFDLSAVAFRARFELCYRIDDDTSRRGMGFELGSGERVMAQFTSGYPTDPSGGYVCEMRVMGSIQPAVVVDACSLTNATPFLGPGQLLDDPVRMSFNAQDNQTDRFRVVGEYFKDYSAFSGWFMHGWQSAATMTGIGTQDYAPVPAFGSAIVGAVSGARGFFMYAEGTAVSLSACRQASSYTITVPGTTLWTAFGAANNIAATVFTYTDAVNASAGAFVIGKSYAIVAAFDTDFTACGAADNMIGTVFTATADGLAATVPLGTPGLALPQFGTGTCTGARKTVISFQKGRFQVGEALIYTSGTTATVASAWAPMSSRLAEIGQGPMASGAFAVGDRPPGVFTEVWNIAGNDCVVPTRNGSILIPKRVIQPKRLWSGNPEVASPYKLGIMYNPGDALKANAYQRLLSSRSDKGAGEQWCGEYVPVSAQINFTNTIAIGLHSVNIRKMTRLAVGKYKFEFHYPLARSDWSFSLGKDGFYMIGWDVGVVFPAANSCEVWVYNAAGALADIPAGAFVSLTIQGGDV